MGLEVEMLSPKETRALAPSLTKHFDIIGGKYCPTDGTANPLLVVKAICRAAKRIGVQIKEREAVTRLKMKAQRITCAVTNAGEYHANTFVNATGPWSREICYMVGLDFPATVKRDQLLITEVVPPCIGQFVSYGRMYLRQALEGNVHLWGGCHPVESPDKWITPEAFIHAAGNINGVFPHLMKVNVIRGFAGLLNCLPDEIPILDRAPNIENFFLVTGFSGHGFCLGPIVGRLISEWIVEGKPSLDMDHFRWTRFENVFLN